MTTFETTPMLIESAIPRPNAVLTAHAVVHADLATTFAAARSLDFLTVRTPLLTASMWVRGLPERLHGRPTVQPTQLLLAQGTGLPGWLLLGERPDQEIAFGAVGKFWQPTIEWRDVPQEQFEDFAEPGWGKIAANFSVARYGVNTLLTYECRTVTTNLESRQRFWRYWVLIRPFVSHIMRATVTKIRYDAEAAWADKRTSNATVES